MRNVKWSDHDNSEQLLYPLSAEQAVDHQQMLLVNRGSIRNVIEINEVRKKSSRALVYSTEGLVTLVEYLTMVPVNKKMMAGLLRQLIDFLKAIEINGLDMDKICFEIERVMVLPSKRKLLFVYVPIVGFRQEHTVVNLLQELLENAVFSKYEDNHYVNGLIDLVNQEEDFSVYKLDVYTESIAGKDRSTASAKEDQEKRRCPKCHALIRRGDSYCFSCGAKLHEDTEKPYILRIKNRHKIMIDSTPFYLGKLEGENRYFISDNPLISRIHAKIIKNNGQHYICDLDSTNGTYINGLRIPANENYELNDGTVFYLVNEEFIFYTWREKFDHSESNEWICRQCQEKNPANAVYCGNCGAPKKL